MTDDANTQLLSYNLGAVRFRVTRCFKCGRWWAYETFREGTPGCPVCAGEEAARLRAEIAKRDRAIAALRGRLPTRKS